MADLTDHGFTPRQMAWLERQFAVLRGFDRPTVMWMFGGLTALGIAASSFLWAEIGSVREEIGSVREEIDSLREELREEIRENRTAITELAKGQARIEAILEERLPRNR